MNRRNFIRKGALASVASLVGARIVFADRMPAGYLPLAWEQSKSSVPFGKNPEMVVLGDRPWNIEAQAHLLDDAITPASKMFVRNNGHEPKGIDEATWTMQIDGESASQVKTFTLKDLKERFTKHTYQLTLECAGNGRSEFYPPTEGNQWTVGGVSCARWAGVRVRDLLQEVGVKSDAVYLGYYGADRHLSGDEQKVVISRGIPIAKALQDETLIAYEMNGAPIPIAHGFPLRLVAGGWPASVSGKWLKRLSIRNKVHDGAKMEGQSYRMPCKPVAPGSEVANEDMCIIESMPVKSLVTFPKTGAILAKNKTLQIRGHAWAGELEVSQVQISIDFGSTWQNAQLDKPANRLAWQRWNVYVRFPQPGYYEVWAKATDSRGSSQPMLVPGWNPKGYLNNACHRIAVRAL